MSTVMSDNERIAMLQAIGINPDGAALSALPAAPVQPVHVPATSETDVVLAPPGVDPRAMPVEEINFDARLLDKFPSLEGDGLRAASDYVFSLYKSYGKNKLRNGALHRKITSFITATRRARFTPDKVVTEGIKASTQERDMAALLAMNGVDTERLAKALTLLAAAEGDA